MAEDKGIIKTDAVEVEVDGEKIEVGPGIQSVTKEVPHEADASSAPGPYNDLELNRPPVSTNDPQTPIAHSLIAGAGAPQNTGPHPLVEGPHPDVAYVGSQDKANVEKVEEGGAASSKADLEKSIKAQEQGKA